MESSDESAGEDTYLATSSTRRKLAELVAKKEAKTLPVAAVRFDDAVLAEPSSPTTRRRNIIMREMSVSLRQSKFADIDSADGSRPDTGAQNICAHDGPSVVLRTATSVYFPYEPTGTASLRIAHREQPHISARPGSVCSAWKYTWQWILAPSFARSHSNRTHFDPSSIDSGFVFSVDERFAICVDRGLGI